MQPQEFFLSSDGVRLHAKLDFPDADQTRRPVLILAHGFTGHMEERHILGVRDAAIEAGYAVMRLDLYGHGRSEGRFHDHTLLKWTQELMDAIDYVRAQDWSTFICLAGHSAGGLATMVTAGIKADQLRAILPLAPAVVIWDGARRGQLLGVPFDPKAIPESVTMYDGRTLGGNYVRVAQMLPVEEAIDRFDGPVLIVHADTDEAVPVHYAIEAAQRYRNATLRILKGDTHCYDHHLSEVQSAVRDFLTGLNDVQNA